jgi:hypothetical protein
MMIGCVQTERRVLLLADKPMLDLDRVESDTKLAFAGESIFAACGLLPDLTGF